MREKLMGLYIDSVQIKPRIKIRRIKWLDKTIGYFFIVSLLMLLAKIGGEALAEAWIK